MNLTWIDCLTISRCKEDELSPAQIAAAKALIQTINLLGYPLQCRFNSFIRTERRQIEIYKEKARKKEFPFPDGVFNINKVPMGSAHISGNACDIADPDGKLKAWIKLNVSVLEKLGLYCEDFKYTPAWVHFQRIPPKSGSRFFKP